MMYETMIVEVDSYVAENKLRKNTKLYFVQDNKEVVRYDTNEFDVIKEYNALGWFLSGVDASNRQFIMTRELYPFHLQIHPQTKGE